MAKSRTPSGFNSLALDLGSDLPVVKPKSTKSKPDVAPAAASAAAPTTAPATNTLAVAQQLSAGNYEPATKPAKKGKKAKINDTGWGDEPTKKRDTFFARQAADAQNTFGGDRVLAGSQTQNMIIGIPCPAFVYEYVTCQDCFVLGLIVQLVARYGVGKTALMAEFGRWFDMAQGGLVLIENETKFNPHWFLSIMGKEAYHRMRKHDADSVENWQEHLTWAVKKMQSDMVGVKKARGPGRTFPVLFGVDSIMGKMSREVQEKIFGAEGAGGKHSEGGTGFAEPRGFAIEAGSITKYLKTFPQKLRNWPFSLVLINHLKMQKDDMGHLDRIKTGGELINFQESFELELKKIGGPKKKISCTQFEGVPVEISCEKNSFGPTGRRAYTRLLWWHEKDPTTGKQVQRSVWDWDWATVHLLNRLMRAEGESTYLRARLKDIDFHLEVTDSGDITNQAWSKNLGMTAKTALSWSEVGCLIRENETLLNTLRDALCIVRRPHLVGDYYKQKNQIKKKMP